MTKNIPHYLNDNEVCFWYPTLSYSQLLTLLKSNSQYKMMKYDETELVSIRLEGYYFMFIDNAVSYILLFVYRFERKISSRS